MPRVETDPYDPLVRACHVFAVVVVVAAAAAAADNAVVASAVASAAVPSAELRVLHERQTQ